MTALAVVDLQGGVLEHKGALLFRVTGETAVFASHGQLKEWLAFLQMGVMAGTARHRSLRNRMVKGLVELSPRGLMAAGAKNRLIGLEQS